MRRDRLLIPYLISQLSDDSLELASISGGLGLDHLEQSGVVLGAPQVQEGGVQLAEGILESAEELGQRRGSGDRSFTDDASSRSLEFKSTWLYSGSGCGMKSSHSPKRRTGRAEQPRNTCSSWKS